MRVADVADRHEVRHVGDAVLAQEPGQQDVGVRQVHLLQASGRALRRDAEPAALRIVQERREDGRRVEVREAQVVDPAVRGDERDGLEVADHPVVLDWLVAHGVPSLIGAAGMVLELDHRVAQPVRTDADVTREREVEREDQRQDETDERGERADHQGLHREAPDPEEKGEPDRDDTAEDQHRPHRGGATRRRWSRSATGGSR